MDILLIGSGGREHALAWKLAKSKRVNKIYVAPGNGGTAKEKKCTNINITDIEELIKFAKGNNIDLTIVGPEEPLIKGIVNRFKEEELRIFGPAKDGAELEGSKSFSKDFMKKYGVKTAEYEVFYEENKVKEYLKTCKYPVVIKADGLAAGKGVVICESLEEGLETIDLFMVSDIFKGAGKKVVIEEFLKGVEASILSITDGHTIIPFLSAKDHKQIFDDNKGPNTGGMGVVCPNPYVTEEVLEDFRVNIMDKTLIGIREEGFDFKGIIFFGIMITEDGAKLLEYNVRMGDPETQSVLSLMETDLLELIEASIDERLNEMEVKWKDEVCLNVVMASRGYPATSETGYEINILDDVKDDVFIAGAKIDEDKLITSGGRVLSVIGRGKTIEEARENVYKNIEKVNFEGAYFRKDIGKAK
ncbi:phosphoribosylamine--glycine ligase [Clostridium sardiniense]|uniref:Phosphoribosylamine--glycine ligase n=1 Tax=Clostridium sardiniense TaxID=29369 RepID=A0ABS7L2D6_CLOSR|nr:phosphoribosylamine--glycine ligase [Clostridium sardiniense]MBY0757229.1 phosphoribosylamine--glycine ligase [Clostridium sardiniense]MBY0757238.1 phosphoribosylamine--glycine ligase [Clostridium sardiniense]MDQ0460154.1 phosphoribosylamine--glycine ligase [Clostridium sardiniense]